MQSKEQRMPRRDRNASTNGVISENNITRGFVLDSRAPEVRGGGGTVSANEFDANAAIIAEIAALAERMGHGSATVVDLASELRRPPSEIHRVFELLGLRPRAWSDPEHYAVQDILESATRHEVSSRCNRPREE
jgi:hypothetical protein